MPPKPVRTVDGFRPVPRRVATVQVPQRPAEPLVVPQPQPTLVAPTVAPIAAKPKRRTWVTKLQWAAIIGAGVIVGLVVQAIPLGYLAVGVYAGIALLKHIPSRFTLLLAAGALALAPFGIVIGHGAVANGFSLIGFLLLSVGVVTLGIELNKERRQATIEHGTSH
jgi:hypothetical protein